MNQQIGSIQRASLEQASLKAGQNENDTSNLRNSYMRDQEQASRFVKKTSSQGTGKMAGAHSSAKSNINSLKDRSELARED